MFRHNVVTQNNVVPHGTEGGRARGVRSVEIYQNTFTTNTLMARAVGLRGGTGVIWGNVAQGTGGPTGYLDFADFHSYRSSTQYGNYWGSVTGSNPWDQNADGTGHIALDQCGAGVALDQIRGMPPINQRTGTAAWPREQIRADLRLEQ